MSRATSQFTVLPAAADRARPGGARYRHELADVDAAAVLQADSLDDPSRDIGRGGGERAPSTPDEFRQLAPVELRDVQPGLVHDVPGAISPAVVNDTLRDAGRHPPQSSSPTAGRSGAGCPARTRIPRHGRRDQCRQFRILRVSDARKS